LGKKGGSRLIIQNVLRKRVARFGKIRGKEKSRPSEHATDKRGKRGGHSLGKGNS